MTSPIIITVHGNSNFMKLVGGITAEATNSVETTVTAIANVILNVDTRVQREDREIITDLFIVNSGETDRPTLRLYITGTVNRQLAENTHEARKTFVEAGLRKRYPTAIVSVAFNEKRPNVSAHPTRVAASGHDTSLPRVLEELLIKLDLEDIEKQNSLAALRDDIDDLMKHVPHNHTDHTQVSVWNTHRDHA